MKLPMLWLVTAFAAGIALAARWHGSLPVWVAVAALAILVSGILLWREHRTSAWVLALVAWIALGALATNIEHASVPVNHVARLIATGRLDTSDPLRWRGRLREDPMALPWGRRFDIDLEQVEQAGETAPVSGGLRLNLYGEARADDQLQSLHAGDRVEALVKARPPRNFLDPGAFDLRGFLARQKVDLTGSLRSGELLQLIDRRARLLRSGSRAHAAHCWFASTLSSRANPRARLCCELCSSVTAASWIPRSSPRSR